MSLTFANPWMLAGLAAVGLPVIVHFLTRARPRPVVFPPFRFLVEACAGQQSIHRLRTIVLLTLRCLAVLALVLLFSRPALRSNSPGATQGHTRVAIVVDASLSMRAVQSGLPLFARAKTEAAEVLRQLDGNAEAAVILAGASPRPILPALSRNISALHDALVQSEATFEAGEPAAALAAAKKMLGDGGTLYVFSDFQQANWARVSELPAGITARLRSVSSAAFDNIGITATRIAPAAPVIGEPIEVICSVFNSSPTARKQSVRLALGDISQTTEVLVPPFSSADAAFRVSFPQPGIITGKAFLDADALREDDTRHLVVRVHKSMQLLVLSDADAEDQRSAAFFVSRALVPSAQAAPGLALIRRHSQDADRGILETADGFVLAAPATLSGEALEVIVRRVKDGAQLLVFLDGNTSTSLLAPSLAPPFQLVRAVTSASGEPLVGARKLFAGADAADWSHVRVHRRFQTQLLPGRGDEVVLSYEDNSPALTVSPAGKGVVAFVNVPLTPDGTDFIGHPLFPSVMHELLRVLRRGDEAREAVPGSSWTLDAQTSGDSGVVVNDPRGQPVTAQVLSSGRITRLSVPPSAEPGVFVAKQGDAVVGAAAVNADPGESDLRAAALEKIKAGERAAVTLVRDDGDLAVAADARSLWPQCAAAAALFLLAEMLLLALWPLRTSVKPPGEVAA